MRPAAGYPGGAQQSPPTWHGAAAVVHPLLARAQPNTMARTAATPGRGARAGSAMAELMQGRRSWTSHGHSGGLRYAGFPRARALVLQPPAGAWSANNLTSCRVHQQDMFTALTHELRAARCERQRGGQPRRQAARHGARCAGHLASVRFTGTMRVAASWSRSTKSGTCQAGRRQQWLLLAASSS